MRDKGIKIRDTFKQHILNNKKEYIVVMLFFLVGIFLGDAKNGDKLISN